MLLLLTRSVIFYWMPGILRKDCKGSAGRCFSPPLSGIRRARPGSSETEWNQGFDTSWVRVWWDSVYVQPPPVLQWDSRDFNASLAGLCLSPQPGKPAGDPCRLNGAFVIIAKKKKNLIIWWKREYVPLHILGPQTPQLGLQHGAGC